MAKKIMAWSECSIEIGNTGANDAFAASLTSIGTIKDKSSSLEPSDGDVLEAIATGGKRVAREQQEGGFKLTTRVIEPEASLLTLLGIGVAGTGLNDDYGVKTHVVDGEWSVKLTPKNVGAKGIKAPKTSITYKPGWSEEEGNYADIDFEILKGEGDYWYSIFTKPSAASTYSAVAEPAANPKTAGYYEEDGSGNYRLTWDTTAVNGKTYYEIAAAI